VILVCGKEESSAAKIDGGLRVSKRVARSVRHLHGVGDGKKDHTA
jgi:hypothetical protein